MENERKDITYQIQQGHKLQTLIHYVNKETLVKQHGKQQSNKATGVDRMTKEEYGANLETNIEKLLEKMKKFSYRPQAVRRAYIPKSDGNLRPLGIPSYEDKLVQGCMTEVLTEIYENKFLEFSYGFRPNKNCHQAIKEIHKTIMAKKVNFILDCDIKGFFDNVDHKWLMKFLENDIGDKNFLRYIVRFLKSGVMEDMKCYESDKGTPQGGLISPVLANVYLHYVLDLWFKYLKEKGIIKGEVYLIRYADDFVVMFQYKEQAEKFYKMLIKRLAKFGLEITEDKTRIIPFGRYFGTKETFDFLGFMHYNGTTRTGRYMVGHKISKKKKKTKKQAIKQWIKEHRHLGFEEIIKKINRKIIGLYAYYGINGMIRELQNLRNYVGITIYHVMRKRSQRNKLTKEQFSKIMELFPLARPRVYHNIYAD